MSDYISREAAKRNLRTWITECVLDGDTESADRFRDCIDLLDSLDAADVAPVVHGMWICYPGCGVTRCSVCNWSIEECWDSSRCPDCGAKMDGGNQ